MSTLASSSPLPVTLNSTAADTPLSAVTLSHFKQIHARILRCNLPSSFLLELLISSPSPSPSLSSACINYAISVFIAPPPLPNKLLRALSRSSNPEIALLVYEKIRRDGLLGMDRFTFPPLLKAASKVSGLKEGREIHGVSAKMGFDKDPFVETGLVSMYAACGQISDARLVFDKMSHRDVVAWSIMFDGYCQCGLFDDALQLFEEMKNSNVELDEMVLSTVISACGRARNLRSGKAVHDFIVENNVVMDSYLRSALVTMYASCGSMEIAEELLTKTNTSSRNLIVLTAMVSGFSRVGRIKEARLIFDQMDEKDLICWSAMISGYAESDQPKEAINLFNVMLDLGIKPDQVTLLSVISACARLGVLEQAKWIHMYAEKSGFGGALRVNNALIDMYAKCGNLGEAMAVFEKIPRRNVISWTSMINSFAIHGDANNALNFFHQMKCENVEPNGVTFVGVLYACSHAGIVKEGQRIFELMINEHNITPKHEHYGCMVDLFGRANLLREALNVVETMPLAPNVVTWGSLMAACQLHGENELGEFAAKRVLELEPDHDGALVLLSNIYAKERRWQDVGELRNLMKQKGICKERGWSWIELNNEVHEFSMADKQHKLTDQIYDKLDEVVRELKLVGYTPNTGSVLVDLEEEEKKEVVLWHSEKLALCYGLITKEQGSCLRIVKNLRVCQDCHTFMKHVSKVFAREIVVRDRTRFHHYKDGVCSCNDYW